MRRNTGIAIGGVVVVGVIAGIARHFYKKNKQTKTEEPSNKEQRAEQSSERLNNIDPIKPATIEGLVEAVTYFGEMIAVMNGNAGDDAEYPKMELLEVFSLKIIEADFEVGMEFVSAAQVFSDKCLELDSVKRSIVGVCQARCLDRYRKIVDEPTEEVDRIYNELVMIRNAYSEMLLTWFGGEDSAGYQAFKVMDMTMASHGYIIREVPTEMSDRYYEKVAEEQNELQ